MPLVVDLVSDDDAADPGLGPGVGNVAAALQADAAPVMHVVQGAVQAAAAAPGQVAQYNAFMAAVEQVLPDDGDNDYYVSYGKVIAVAILMVLATHGNAGTTARKVASGVTGAAEMVAADVVAQLGPIADPALHGAVAQIAGVLAQKAGGAQVAALLSRLRAAGLVHSAPVQPHVRKTALTWAVDAQFL